MIDKNIDKYSGSWRLTMEHFKTYNSIVYTTPKGIISIEGPLTSEVIASYSFNPQLISFRNPKLQQEALIKIADRPESRIIAAIVNDAIVGYVTFAYPDPVESWSKSKLENLLELGAIEVAPDFRNLSIGKNLLKVAMLDDAIEDYIIITTEYYWHWDLKRTGLNIWEYRRIMERMMNACGFIEYATDDPEIRSHPVNCLMARIGKRVDKKSIEQFDKLRFRNSYL